MPLALLADPRFIAGGIALLLIALALAVFLLKRKGGPRRLDLFTPPGLAAFHRSAFAEVSLTRTRASYFYANQYASFSEREIPLDDPDPPANANTKVEDKLKVLVADASGGVRPLFTVEYSKDNLRRLQGIVAEWRKKRGARSGAAGS